METFSALLAICAGNSPVPGEFPAQRPVTRSFDDLFDLRLNKRLSKQSWGWWFETLSRSLWRHRNDDCHEYCLTETSWHGTAFFITSPLCHDDLIKWKHFRVSYWPFARGIHRSSVNSPYKGQWRGTLMFSLVCACRNGWVNNRDDGDLRRHRTHYDVTAMCKGIPGGFPAQRVSNVDLWLFRGC